MRSAGVAFGVADQARIAAAYLAVAATGCEVFLHTTPVLRGAAPLSPKQVAYGGDSGDVAAGVSLFLQWKCWALPAEIKEQLNMLTLNNATSMNDMVKTGTFVGRQMSFSQR